MIVVISRIPGNRPPKRPYYCFKSRNGTFANIYINHHDDQVYALPICIKLCELILGPITPAFIEDEKCRELRYWGLSNCIIDDIDELMELEEEYCYQFFEVLDNKRIM